MAYSTSAAARLDSSTDPAEYYYVPRGNGGGGGSSSVPPRTGAVAIAPREPAVVLYGGSPLLGVSPPSFLLSSPRGGAGVGSAVPTPVSAPVGRVMSIDALDELALLRDQSVAVAYRDGIWQARLGRRRVDRSATGGSPAGGRPSVADEPCVLGGGGDDGDLFFGAPDGTPTGLLSPFPAVSPGVPVGETGVPPLMPGAAAAAALAAAAAAAVSMPPLTTAEAPMGVEGAAKVEAGLLESLPLPAMAPVTVTDGGVVDTVTAPAAAGAPEPVSQPPTPMLSGPPVGCSGGVKRRMPSPGESASAGYGGEGGAEAGGAGGLLTAAAVMLRNGLPAKAASAAVAAAPTLAAGHRSSSGSSSGSRCSFPTASGSVGSDSGALDALSSVPMSGAASTAASSLCSSEFGRAAKRSRAVGSGFSAAAAARAGAGFQMAPVIAAKASVPVSGGTVLGAAHGPTTVVRGMTAVPLDTVALADLSGTTAAESRRMSAEERALMLHKRKLRNRASAARSRDRQRASASATGCEVGRLRAEAAAAVAVATAATADATALRADNGRLRAELACVTARLVAAESAAAAVAAGPPATPLSTAPTAPAAGVVTGSRPPAARTAAAVVGAAFAGVAAAMATGEAATVAPTTAAQAAEATGLLRRPSSASLLKRVSSLERMLDLTHAARTGVSFGMSRSRSFLKSC